MKGTSYSAIVLSTLSVASAFTDSGASSGLSGVCVQQKLDLSELGSAILYSCGDSQTRGAELGATRVVNLEGYSPNGDEIALTTAPVIGYVANSNNVQCALGSTVTVLQVRDETGQWVDSGETFPPPFAFDEQCPDTVAAAGRWIEAGSAYTDCGMDDFQCNWVIVPDEFYGSAGPYYTNQGGPIRCMVPDTYVPVCQASNLERFDDFVQVRGDGLSKGIEGAFPSLYWYNNIATAQENRWVCTIPQGAVIEMSEGTPLSVSGSTRQVPFNETGTLYVCEGAGDCTLEFEAPPVTTDETVDPLETKPEIGLTQFDGVESTSIGDASSICEQMEVLSTGDGPIGETNGTIVVLQGLVGNSAGAFCTDGAGVALPGMPGNPDWLPASLTEEEEWVAISGSRECQVPHLALPPNFHPALTCGEGFKLAASINSGFNTSVYHTTSLYLYGENATLVSDKLNGVDSLTGVTCRQRVSPFSAAGSGTWAQLKIIGTAGVLLMTLLAW